jgi:K+-transporting ATPase KdpF subunit
LNKNGAGGAFSGGGGNSKEAYVRPDLSGINDHFFPARARLRARMREAVKEEFMMGWEAIVGVVVSALLLFYLTYALLKPERF